MGGEERPIRSEFSITRDGGETRLAAMQCAMLLRHDPKFFLAKHPKTGELLSGCGPEQQRRAEEMGREYVGLRSWRWHASPSQFAASTTGG